jgi:hypothetical protein
MIARGGGDRRRRWEDPDLKPYEVLPTGPDPFSPADAEPPRRAGTFREAGGWAGGRNAPPEGPEQGA